MPKIAPPPDACTVCGWVHDPNRQHRRSLAGQKAMAIDAYQRRCAAILERDPLRIRLAAWKHDQFFRGVPADAETTEYARVLLGDPCAYCGAREHIGIDHIVPISLGGTTCIANLTAICRACNARKRTADVISTVFKVQRHLRAVRLARPAVAAW